MEVTLENLINKPAILCAVGEYTFRLGDLTFEVIEDSNDGYRSCIQELVIRENLRPTFQEKVFIIDGKEVMSDDFEGIALLSDMKEIILLIGTNYTDYYYPYVVFEFHPENMICNKPTLEEMLMTVTE